MDPSTASTPDSGGAGLPPSTAFPTEVASPVEPPPLLTPVVAPEESGTPFVFHGEAREYFRVWIVNTLLTVATLGIFAAWAKVRKRRYLRGNTELLGHRFNYTANPARLLIGNAIVVALFLAYMLFGSVYPALRVIALLVFVTLLPWIVVRSLSFNAHHTVYRGLRFRFHPSLSAAAMLYLFQPFLIVATLGLYYPSWARQRQEFTIGRHRLGTAYFRLGLKSGPFYRVYFVAGAAVFAGLLLIGALYGFWLKPANGHVPSPTQLIPAMLVYGMAAYFAKHYIFAETFNLVWNGARLDEHRFRARLDCGTWLSLQFVNLGAIVATCGLAYPWAVIRTTRYALSCLELQTSGAIETIAAVNSARGSAVGDTAAEFAGLDFGL